jgi:RNA polymerase sigma-70 factor (ECF subfamily)
MLEYRGIDAARQFFAAVILRTGRSYRAVPTRANGQPALGMYVADPHTGVYRAHGLLVVTIDASVMARFGLPRMLPGKE